MNGGINTVVFIFAGFMDSGKTTALQGLIVDNERLQDRKKLIICTEEGETEFDHALLARENIDLISVEEEEDLTTDCLTELADTYHADTLFIEFNGMWDLKRFLTEEIPPDWALGAVLALVNAQTYDLYQRNMRQFIMNPLSVADVVLFNRCDEKTRKGDIRRSLKILNSRAEIHFTRMDGSLDDSVDDLLLPDNSGIIDVDDQLFCPWFVDCIEHADKYYGKRVRTKVMAAFGDGLAENQFFAGRMAAICCAADARFIGFVAECSGTLPGNATWLDITATIKKGTTEGNKITIVLEIEEAVKTAAPDDPYLYF